MKKFIAPHCVAFLAALGLANVATADVPGYTMTVWTDAAHGSKVVTGNYARAIEKLTRSPVRYANNIEGQTNLCVAYAKTGKLDKAIASCDQAVAMIESGKLSIAHNRFAPKFAERQKAIALAIALSNRGVLRVAQGQYELASEDFRNAAELDTDVMAATVNLARFEADRATPQVAGL